MNKDLKDYFNILCNNDYPYFIDKYLELEELTRLKYIGQFCGCDYNKLYNIKFWYTRFDHSVATALITWQFTKDKNACIASLLHDIGTPIFSHAIDFYLDDAVKQESSELDVSSILKKNNELIKLLNEDNINIENILNVKDYFIAENKSPKLCADRLDGVLHTAYIWLNKYDISQIKEVYEKVINIDNKELGFSDVDSASKFFEMVYDYAIALQENEDQFTMRFIADKLKELISIGVLKFEDFYTKKESEIISLFEKNCSDWNNFTNLNEINKNSNMYERIEVKKRYVNPLIVMDNNEFRIDEINNARVKKLINNYEKFEDSKHYGM